MLGESGGTRMSLLEHPKAQALLAEADLTADSVRSCRERLTRFIERYLRVRMELRKNANKHHG